MRMIALGVGISSSLGLRVGLEIQSQGKDGELRRASNVDKGTFDGRTNVPESGWMKWPVSILPCHCQPFAVVDVGNE